MPLHGDTLKLANMHEQQMSSSYLNPALSDMVVIDLNVS